VGTHAMVFPVGNLTHATPSASILSHEHCVGARTSISPRAHASPASKVSVVAIALCVGGERQRQVGERALLGPGDGCDATAAV
jgi:hypothetical protein